MASAVPTRCPPVLPPPSGAREWKRYDGTKKEWRAQTLQIRLFDAEEAAAETATAEKELEEAWAAASMVVISGATGPRSKNVDGRFELVEREVYSKVGDLGTWLFIDSKGNWVVGPTKGKDARKTALNGWAHTVAGADGKPPPSGAREWQLYDYAKKEWHKHTLQAKLFNPASPWKRYTNSGRRLPAGVPGPCRTRRARSSRTATRYVWPRASSRGRAARECC